MKLQIDPRSAVSDALLVGGLSAVGYGCWQVWPPLAWVVVGAALLWYGYRLGKPEPQRRA